MNKQDSDVIELIDAAKIRNGSVGREGSNTEGTCEIAAGDVAGVKINQRSTDVHICVEETQKVAGFPIGKPQVIPKLQAGCEFKFTHGIKSEVRIGKLKIKGWI